MSERIEFDYERTDEQLIAYSSLSIRDRLQWLDELRQFTLMLREAPEMTPENRLAAGGDRDSRTSPDASHALETP